MFNKNSKFYLAALIFLGQSSCVLNLITEQDARGKNPNTSLAYNAPCSRLGSCSSKDKKIKKTFKWSEKKYLQKLDDPNPAARTRAVTEVAEHNFNSDVIIKKVEAMAQGDESKWVRRAAVKSLSKISGIRSKNTIASACNDKDEWVRHSAKKVMLELK